MTNAGIKRESIRQIEMVRIDVIDLGDRQRPVIDEAVEALMISVRDIGIRNPITVRYCPERPLNDGSASDSYILVAGAHRLAAAKRLGRTQIACFVMDDELDAELWQISENLHRAELTALERADHTARWIELSNQRTAGALSSRQTSSKQSANVASDKPFQVETVSTGGRGKTGGVNAAARDLNISKSDAHRAVKIALLSPQAKKAAKDVGLDDNKSALLDAVKAGTPEQQVQCLLKHGHVDRTNGGESVRQRATRELSLILTSHVPVELWEALRVNLAALGMDGVVRAIEKIGGATGDSQGQSL